MVRRDNSALPRSNHASKLTEERAKVMASILCIDDDPRVLDLYKALLGAKGYTVLTAPDGPTGLAITRKYSISVVVLDFRMPGLDGNQVARVGESLIENSGEGCHLGMGEECWRHDPTLLSSLPYHSCYSARVESGVYCSWTDHCPQTRFRSGIWWNRRG